MAIPPDRVTTAMGFDGTASSSTAASCAASWCARAAWSGTLGASIQTLFGGNITLYTELCERARQDAFDLMLRHAPRSAPTPSSPCATTPTRWRRASPRCWRTAPRSSSSRPGADGAILGVPDEAADPAEVPVNTSCDTLVALGSETRSGRTLFAKNSDRPTTECQPLQAVPARRHPPGATVRCTYLEIPEAPETLAVLGSRPWWIWGFEHGVNEAGWPSATRPSTRARRQPRPGSSAWTSCASASSGAAPPTRPSA